MFKEPILSQKPGYLIQLFYLFVWSVNIAIECKNVCSCRRMHEIAKKNPCLKNLFHVVSDGAQKKETHSHDAFCLSLNVILFIFALFLVKLSLSIYRAFFLNMMEPYWFTLMRQLYPHSNEVQLNLNHNYSSNMRWQGSNDTINKFLLKFARKRVIWNANEVLLLWYCMVCVTVLCIFVCPLWIMFTDNNWNLIYSFYETNCKPSEFTKIIKFCKRKYSGDEWRIFSG